MHFRSVAIRGLTAATAGVALFLAAGDASAQSGKGAYVGGWSVSGDLGYAVPNTDQFGNGLSWRAGVSYSPIPQFDVGLELGRFSTQVTQPEENGLPTHDIASGQIEVLPLCLTLQYHIPISGTMATINLLGGAGYYFVDYAMADAPSGVFAASGVEGLPNQVVNDSWGFHAGAGVEYALSGWFSLTAEARYVFLSPDVSGTAKDNYTLGGSLDLNTWLFTGGIKVAF